MLDGRPASEHLFFQDALQVLPVAVLDQRLSQALQLFGIDPARAIADLFRAGDLEALAALEGRDVLASFQEAVVRARVQPGVTTAHDLDVELLLLQVQHVQISDFQLTPCRGPQAACQFDDLVVVEVQTGHGIV